MGSLCSKSGSISEPQTVLGPHSATTSRQAAARPDPRTAALEAAERRLKAEQARGTNSKNPNAGKLASQIGNSSKAVPERREEERLVWD